MKRRHVTEQARQVLRALLHDKIDCEPFGRGRHRGYRFRGDLTIGGLIGGAASLAEHAREMVAPTGTTRPNWVVSLDGTFRVAA